jgi:drug/metabolite transporter (DMT)-like permease
VLGVLFTLLAAASFGLNNATVRRGTITGTVTQIVSWSMPIGLVMFGAAALAFGQIDQVTQFAPDRMALLASAGIVHFVFGRYCNYRSIQAMGANLSGPVQQWALLVTLTLAIVFLHETLNGMKVVGIGLLVLGPAMIVAAQKSRRAKSAGAAAVSPQTTKFQPKLAEGYAFSIGSCLCYGSSPILVRAGLEGMGVTAGLAGGVLSYGAATVAVVALMLVPVARRDASGIKRENVGWFLWTGVTVCISQIFLYLAMAIAPVTLVQPLMRFTNVFVTLFAWFFNRNYEIFDAAVLGAIGISLIGGLALALDPAWVSRMIDAPPWLAGALAWTWPY